MIARVLFWLGVSALVYIAYLLLADSAQASDIPIDPRQAHAYADAVLGPRFHAAVNDYEYHHPRDDKAGSWDHTRKLDRNDNDRWTLVVSTFKDYERAMKIAGFTSK